MLSYNTKNKIESAVLHVVVVILSLVMIFPFIWMILGSFKFNQDVLAIPVKILPPRWNFGSYAEAFSSGPFVRYYINSVIVLVFAVLINVITCTTAGYGFAKFKFKGRNFLFSLTLSTLMIPIHSVVVPLFALMANMKLVNTYAGLIIPLSLSGFGVFLMRQFFYSVPDELIEAAKLDGANNVYIFLKISVPLSKVALISLVIFHSQYVWKNLLWALVIVSRTELRTLTVGIALFSGVFFTPYPQQLAMSVSACVPMVILFLFLSKYFIKGSALTGIKG